MNPLRVLLKFFLVSCAVSAVNLVQAEDVELRTIRNQYQDEVQPLIQQYCNDCHSSTVREGDLDLQQFDSFHQVRNHPRIWIKVAEMLDTGEMPPKDSPQITAEQRANLREWIDRFLNREANEKAGDPGPVVLRRLNNAEFNYTVQDLTGLSTINPTEQFPADSAAGEGFTNTGQSLVMSPALLAKYFDAGKEIAAHAVFHRNGFRFSESTMRQDWIDEILHRIKSFYLKYTDPRGGTQVNLQGLTWETNIGGRLPIDKYLVALVLERENLKQNRKTLEVIAAERGLNLKYLSRLWFTLTGNEPSILLSALREKFNSANETNVVELTKWIEQWQLNLTSFQSVGHVKPWLVPKSPVVTSQELRLPVPPSGGDGISHLFLVAGSAGEQGDGDVVRWSGLRLVAPGKPEIPIGSIGERAAFMERRKSELFTHALPSLQAAARVLQDSRPIDFAVLSQEYKVPEDVLAGWFELVGIATGRSTTIDSYLTGKIDQASGYNFVKGWGTDQTPLILGNESGDHVRIPGNMKPHGVVAHPSPTEQIVVGWRSPVNGWMKIDGAVTHAHPECGNGVTWSVELRKGAIRQQLVSGVAQGTQNVPYAVADRVLVREGDFITLAIGPRDGNHSCDLTDLELRIQSQEEGGPTWNLTEEVSGSMQQGNPHDDRSGRKNVWHFFTEPVRSVEYQPQFPEGSILSKWMAAEELQDKAVIANRFQELLTSGAKPEPNSPDGTLMQQLENWSGPLLRSTLAKEITAVDSAAKSEKANDPASTLHWGIQVPTSSQVKVVGNGDEVLVNVPSAVEIRLPADVLQGYELVGVGAVDSTASAGATVQLQLASQIPSEPLPLLANAPIVVRDTVEGRSRIQGDLDQFRELFPAALCYLQIVPVDEVVTLELFHREDENLVRLMLDEKQAAELDDLWDQLHFVSGDLIQIQDAYDQLMQYATQDSNPALFEPLRKPIAERADQFRQVLLDAQPRQLESVIEFAASTYRKPLSEEQRAELVALYQRLRKEEIPHEDALRLLMARLFVSPDFLYRLEVSPSGGSHAPVDDWELASRLSYFLWSSAPDRELRELAVRGELRNSDVLAEQADRMMRDPKINRLSVEFACQWLHIHGFDQLEEKSERHFPSFTALREPMYREAQMFFTDLMQRDGRVTDVFDADHTFLNAELAKHYGIPNVEGDQWRRVEGVRSLGRGGILGFGATLAKQAGASRTSPILRGNWLSEVLLGEKLPKPPKNVPQLPEDEAAETRTVRELTELHSQDPNCSGCHKRIDPYGFAMEDFDAIGRLRTKDLADRPIDSTTTLPDGRVVSGSLGLREYLMQHRKDQLIRQFCQKLLGYALGRSIQLSDKPLLDKIGNDLKANDYRMSTLIKAIVTSTQYRDIRGFTNTDDE